MLLIFTIVAGTIDQFIRPVLIRRGADLPVLLILGGVIGGIISFGMLGIFIGPTVLAVAYTLLNAWMTEANQREISATRPSGAEESQDRISRERSPVVRKKSPLSETETLAPARPSVAGGTTTDADHEAQHLGRNGAEESTAIEP